MDLHPHIRPVQPDEQPAKPIVIEWTEAARYRVELSPGELRRLFGLGGTPDDALTARVAMIGQHAPTELAKLYDLSTYLGSTAYALETVDGVKPDEL